MPAPWPNWTNNRKPLKLLAWPPLENAPGKPRTAKQKTAWQLFYVDREGNATRRQFRKKQEAEDERIRIEGEIARGVHVADKRSIPLIKAAAAFLAEFVGERDGAPIPWAHLDIAGPSTNNGSPFGHTPSGATGVTVRGLIRTLATMAREAE